ncbi:hypothetical protein SmJEL517_g03475 [Synchytrium microbalum]|uniref:C3H1-type domain-containing protein n=1 Tax=Synchytrium microbalum TaxID=1806994 RepID=A0A507BY81_9FUNG|nr:uncharacterized protein SmJEL517_g03475 [Synchytrium microbalum]TPX33747.1 hypothetical protein SmJEL517_g03475 [Synchytrium microbalum]
MMNSYPYGYPPDPYALPTTPPRSPYYTHHQSLESPQHGIAAYQQMMYQSQQAQSQLPDYMIHAMLPRSSSLALNQQHVNAMALLNQSQMQQQQQPRDTRRATLYKTELCRSWEETGGHCKYSDKCQFAHGMDELRPVDRHPRYKTEMCRTFWEKGSCPYGKRYNCIFDVDPKRWRWKEIQTQTLIVQIT